MSKNTDDEVYVIVEQTRYNTIYFTCSKEDVCVHKQYFTRAQMVMICGNVHVPLSVNRQHVCVTNNDMFVKEIHELLDKLDASGESSIVMPAHMYAQWKREMPQGVLSYGVYCWKNLVRKAYTFKYSYNTRSNRFYVKNRISKTNETELMFCARVAVMLGEQYIRTTYRITISFNTKEASRESILNVILFMNKSFDSCALLSDGNVEKCISRDYLNASRIDCIKMIWDNPSILI